MKIANKKDFDFFLYDCKRKFKEGKVYAGEFKQRRKSKTYPQIKLYWAWISCICGELGYLKTDTQEVHTELKKIVLGYETKEIMGKSYELIPSIKGFDTKQLSKYMEQLKIYMDVEHGIKLPLPEDKFVDEFIKEYNSRS